mmetsp:Transcript_36774/g.59407  ORF Transcript_36774/g.59407 Transcript_36774/m.59407 type:complete len:719 (+) Transcript_36774:162-2318(+)
MLMKSVLLALILGCRLSIGQRCSSSECTGKILPRVDGDIEVPCSIASATIPGGSEVASYPFHYSGNYDLCMDFGRDKTQFCTVTYANFGFADAAGVVVPFGTVLFEGCIPKNCNFTEWSIETAASLMLKIRLDLHRLVGLKQTPVEVWPTSVNELSEAQREYLLTEIYRYDASYFGGSCRPFDGNFDGWSILVAVLLGVFVLLVFSSSVLAHYFERCRSNTFVQWFSVGKNANSLFSQRAEEDFKVLNGIRVLSICWVVAGHLVLFFYLENSYVLNPTTVSDFTTKFWFFVVPSAFFAVDTFLFMSGFLAAVSLHKHFNKEWFDVKRYFLALAIRWCRLVPLYASVYLFCFKILSSSGIESFNPECARPNQFFPRMFFVYGLYNDKDTPLGGCLPMETDWYLMVDMQCFMFIAPFFVYLYCVGARSHNVLLRCVLKYGITIALVATSVVLIARSKVASSSAFYTRFWDRWVPYVFGLLLGMIHMERAKDKDWKTVKSVPTWAVGVLFLFVSVAILGFWVAFFHILLRCQADKCDLGVLAFNTLSKKEMSFMFLPFMYTCYSVLLVLFCYILFLDKKYDVLGLKTFLSADIFTPLAKLTFGVYLVHLPLIYWVNENRHDKIAFSGWNALISYAGFVLLSFTLSYVLYLLVEKPFANILSTGLNLLKKKPEPAESLEPELELKDISLARESLAREIPEKRTTRSSTLGMLTRRRTSTATK